MRTIHIKNIGAIADSGIITIYPITIFCGKQGSGKSTIAKLISTCMWLEKSLMKGEISTKYAIRYNHFKNQFCSYHGIEGFFHDNSFLEYKSDRYIFHYEDQHLTIEEKKEGSFLMPKIMYVPAERNIMVVIEHAERIKRLPSSIQTLQTEYLNALQNIKGQTSLPIDGISVQYDRLNKVTWFNGKGFHVRAQNAASGFQSVAPLALVSDYLSDMVANGQNDPISAEELEKLRAEVAKIQDNKKLSVEVKSVMIENINKRYVLDCFQNIVEEPEQNLYPSSQKNVLNLLLADFNKRKGNGLIITTHSPYILDYLSLNIKAYVASKGSNDETNKINNIVPKESWVKPDQVGIFEIQDEGSVVKLENYDGIPSDNNYLNNAFSDINDLYCELMEIEDGKN